MTDEAAKEGAGTAQDYLEIGFREMRKMITVNPDVHSMRESQRKFDELWDGIIKNAMRLYGKGATREALVAMGRPEDATKMY